MNKPNVYIIDSDSAYVQMFMRNGWSIARDPAEAHLIQFTGGSDVDPMLYDEPKHPQTGSHPARDSAEANIFNTFVDEIPMAGICRGGQFLNVMNGGRMWQHVDNHAVGGGHFLTDHTNHNNQVRVSSTHHQMMDPTGSANYILLATAGLTKIKEDGWGNKIKQDQSDLYRDVEALFFPETNCLCYQPHPEFFNEDHPCQVLYFDYLRNFMGLGA